MSIVLSGIFVYPVKALGGISQAEAEVRPRGLAADRRWVIVRPDGQFISQRTHPRLALVAVRVCAGGLTLHAKGQSSLFLAPPSQIRRRPVRIWDDDVAAAAADPAADQWLSTFLGEQCHLAWMDAECHRPVNPQNALPGEQVSFADGYPCLIISEASLADLNARLSSPLPMNRFRPNLVVSGCDAFAEDNWTRLTIGEARFRVINQCARCSVTTIDQATGHSLAPEPLRTLATYRQVGKGVMFGINLVVEQPGSIRVGDPLFTES